MSRPPLTFTVMALAFAGAWCVAGQSPQKPGAPDLAKELIGTWDVLGPPDALREPPAKGGEMKSFTGRHWSAVVVDPRTGIAVGTHGGTYSLDGDRYVETVEYASPDRKGLLGKTFTFRLKVEGDRLAQDGTDNPFASILRRRK